LLLLRPLLRLRLLLNLRLWRYRPHPRLRRGHWSLH
jgi:hypothetical protein